MNKERKQMNVAELIAELQKQPQDALVSTEGCDCEGAASDVTWDAKFGYVLIGRL
jgi:hypothetical protein